MPDQISSNNGLYGNVRIALQDKQITDDECAQIIEAAKSWGGVDEDEVKQAKYLTERFYDMAMSCELAPMPTSTREPVYVRDWQQYQQVTAEMVADNQQAVNKIYNGLQAAHDQSTGWQTFIQRLLSIQM